MGSSFLMLLIARAIEGIGSSCINVCGMSLIASLYLDDQKRSKVMGIILGSIALGVLIGYPLGSFLYDFVSESAPFIIISAFLFTDLAFQLTFFNLSRNEVCCFLLLSKIDETPLSLSFTPCYFIIERAQ
jgi:DHA1 family solute carrier family 18 vesicular amine transporter 1/2